MAVLVVAIGHRGLDGDGDEVCIGLFRGFGAGRRPETECLSADARSGVEAHARPSLAGDRAGQSRFEFENMFRIRRRVRVLLTVPDAQQRTPLSCG